MMPLWLLACTGEPPVVPDPVVVERDPDVVLIIVDTLRHDALGFTGNPRPTSPNLDALAAESAWFSRAYASATWTLPSVATLFTGQPPWKHRVVHSAESVEDYGTLSEEIPTLATTLGARGYRSAAFINNAFLAPAFGLNQGFDTYDYVGAGLVDHRTAATTVEAALAWLGSSDQPALLVVHFMEPHADYQPSPDVAGTFTADLPHSRDVPLGGEIVDAMITNRIVPPPEDQAYIRAAYDEEVLTIDAAVGTLLDTLRARPGWDTTRLVFTADHGEEFWDYGHFEHGHTTQSVVTGVPLILHAPGVVAGRNDSVVSLAHVHDFLVKGSGALMGLAASGVTEHGRIALMEDTLYTQQQASAVGDDRRYVVNLQTKAETFFGLDAHGDEVLELTDLDAPEAVRLKQALVAARGGLDPTKVTEALAVPDPDTFEQLRALGYLQ